jgi:UDP-N-acetylglucosamine--N-acetylmuramyl-(pentapeptide) pyrophosphoryl-undecaprenol N-acetylglucosamine transferase
VTELSTSNPPIHTADVQPSYGADDRPVDLHATESRRRHIGYLISDRPGALARARAIVPRLRGEVTLFHRGPAPDLDEADLVALPLSPAGEYALSDAEADPVIGPETALLLARWAVERQPDLLIVDGPMDLALLGRCTGLPIVPLRRPGAMVGPVVGAVQDLAAAWLAPFPASLESADVPPEVRRRTLYAGFVSRFEGRGLGRRAARRRLGLPEEGRHVTVLIGGETPPVEAARFEQAAATASAWSFSVVGSCTGVQKDGERLRFHGWCEDVYPHLRAADVVIATSSVSAVADVAAAGRPLALVPGRDAASMELATGLEQLGAAVVLDDWPGALTWPALLADLLDQPTKPLRSLADGRAAKRAAQWIDAWAAAPPRDPRGIRADEREADEALERAQHRQPLLRDGTPPPFATAAEP